MNYRRVLLIASLEGDADVAVTLLRELAPQAEQLVVVALLPARRFAWFADEAPGELRESTAAALQRLRDATAQSAAEVELALVEELDTASLAQRAAAAASELIVFGALPLAELAVVAALRDRCGLGLLWVPAQRAAGARPPAGVLCVALGRQAQAAVAAFLRERIGSTAPVTVLLPGGDVPPDLEVAAAVAGVPATVAFVAPQGLSSLQWLDERMHERPPMLLVSARLPVALLLAARWSAPCLLLPPTAAPATTLLQRDIDLPDLVDDGTPLRLRVEHAAGIGRRTPIPDQALVLVADGRVAARVHTREGFAELPAGLHAEAWGVFRAEGRDAAQPLAAIEQQVAVLRPGPAALLLFDAELTPLQLAALRDHASPGTEALAVRLRPLRSCREIRERLAAAGLAPRVVDASLVLDEGAAFDVPEAVDAVRLARVAARMRVAGFGVFAIVHRADDDPALPGCAVIRADRLGDACWLAVAPRLQPRSLADRLAATTDADRIDGHEVAIELDNALARRWLLDAVAGAQRRIHLQVYMAADDDVGRRVEAALVAAAARGVQVRLLVDSLHGLHGSLGTRNPLLERLAAHAGIELHVARPITALPSLHDLKLRDHRKLVVVDNTLALLGGRNLGHEYYTGFDEVALAEDSDWREVPWLDAGARLRGPAVATLERGFLEAWTEAGGGAFEVADCAAAGPTPLRVVVHRGLRDAATLEAYLALIETARGSIDVVNGFPLILEIQHALLRALRRGVRVRMLFGHLTPKHGERDFGGTWAAARSAATALVHSRVDALVAAGAEGWQFAVAPQPGWAPALGRLRPHVHAKMMCADRRVVAVGSANMDITGGYWETELLLLVEDESVVATLQTRLDALFADSVAVSRDDPQWQQLASAREWLRHWPGVLSI